MMGYFHQVWDSGLFFGFSFLELPAKPVAFNDGDDFPSSMARLSPVVAFSLGSPLEGSGDLVSRL